MALFSSPVAVALFFPNLNDFFMNLDFAPHIPSDFDDSSRVWIFQSSRRFSITEALSMESLLEEFVANWKSHGVPVKGFANLLFGQFLVIMADETATGVSGCSTDSSVRLMKQIEELYKVNLFDRQMLAFFIKENIQLLPLSQAKYALNNGFITPETLYFNNLVSTKEDLMQQWIIPVKESWLAKRLIPS